MLTKKWVRQKMLPTWSCCQITLSVIRWVRTERSARFRKRCWLRINRSNIIVRRSILSFSKRSWKVIIRRKRRPGRSCWVLRPTTTVFSKSGRRWWRELRLIFRRRNWLTTFHSFDDQRSTPLSILLALWNFRTHFAKDWEYVKDICWR